MRRSVQQKVILLNNEKTDGKHILHFREFMFSYWNHNQYVQEMKFSREWEMPNSNTFEINSVRKLIGRYLKQDDFSIDPFSNKSRIAKITNDLNPEMKADYSMDAVDFLKMFKDNSVDFVFYDPPYSLRQVSECYKSVGIEVTTETTQASWRTKHINEIARVLRPGGRVISFGWNSSGVGKKREFEILEILLVAHGGSHNDTICVVERKMSNLFNSEQELERSVATKSK